MVTLDKYTYRVDISRVIDGDTLEIGPGGVQLGFGVAIFTNKGAAKITSKFPTDAELEATKRYSIRLLGINTPETRKGWWTKGLTEDQIQDKMVSGEKSKARTTALVAAAARVWLRSATGQPDNFGRLLGDIILEDKSGALTSLAEILLSESLALPFKE